VAGGGTPHQIDILIINNTEYDLELDKSEISLDGSQGMEVNAGKIVKGAEPPLVIKKMSKARFSASGREASMKAPNGRVFYHNKQEDLHLIFKWNNSGWTTREAATAHGDISGSKVRPGQPTQPWSNLISVKADVDSWTYTVKEAGIIDSGLDTINDFIKAIEKFKIF